MNQIVYQEALDPYHAVFRILRILQLNEREEALAVDHLRVLDFYVLFPFRISTFRFRRKHSGFKQLGVRYEHARPYGEWPDEKALIARMQPIQLAALATLGRVEIIDAPKLTRGLVLLIGDLPNGELEARVTDQNAANPELSAFLKTLINEYPTAGQDGIKSRSGLLEYRYDATA
ncbi:hypothetical protein OS035_28460 [Rhizobium sp. 268]|uniref:ABC-three component system middle component 5 n=1 Tax=Rhizobium sp. 268 TaxID=2996375 RepID=UPI002F922D3E